MTALADIRKAAAVMYGDSLRGSDLKEFNEAHPRDEAGRFATASGGGGGLDPRVQRKARRQRRARRAVGASQVRAAAESAKEDPRSLQHLAQRLIPTRSLERELPTRSGERNKQSAQPPKKVGGKEVDLNDRSYVVYDDAAPIYVPTFMLLDPEQAKQLTTERTFVVGAAVAKWGVDLHAYTEDQLAEYAKNNDISGKVLLSNKQKMLTTDNPEQPMNPESMPMSHSQVVAVDGPSAGENKGMYRITTGGKEVKLPRVEVGVYDWTEVSTYLSDADEYPGINKPNVAKSAIWEEEEHPRDIRSGRFAAVAGGGGGGLDPRIARTQRRRRRGAKALAIVAARPEARPVRELPTRDIPSRPIPMRSWDRELAHRTAHRLVRESPADAEVQFLADPVLRTVEQRVAHYEEHVYPEIRTNLAAADEQIQRAASQGLNGDSDEAVADRVLFSRRFLSGKRTEAQYADPITDQDVEQSVRQLASSQALFNLMQKHGAGQWTMTSGEYVKPETEPATSISVNADDMAALTGYSPIRYDTGFGARTVSIKEFQRLQGVSSDREAAVALSRDLAKMRVEDERGYKQTIVPQLVRFSSGQVSFNQAMADTARVVGNEQAARHYDREESTAIAVSTATQQTRRAAAKRTAEAKAKNAVRAKQEGRSTKREAALDVVEDSHRESKRPAFKVVDTKSPLRSSDRMVTLGLTTYDILEGAEAPDPRVRDHGTYDPIEYDDDLRPILPDPDTPREFVHPKLRPAFDAAYGSPRTGKGRRATS